MPNRAFGSKTLFNDPGKVNQDMHIQNGVRAGGKASGSRNW
jgi:hypothetical protein